MIDFTVAFDRFVVWAMGLVPWLGDRLIELYREKEWLREFARYGSWISFQFFIFRAPMVWFMVELAGAHYILASYVAGMALAIAGFFVSKFWIWRRAKE